MGTNFSSVPCEPVAHNCDTRDLRTRRNFRLYGDETGRCRWISPRVIRGLTRLRVLPSPSVGDCRYCISKRDPYLSCACWKRYSQHHSNGRASCPTIHAESALTWMFVLRCGTKWYSNLWCGLAYFSRRDNRRGDSVCRYMG